MNAICKPEQVASQPVIDLETREWDVYTAICHCQATLGYVPSVSKIMKQAGMRSHSCAQESLALLETLGLIRRYGCTRGHRITLVQGMRVGVAP